MKSFANTLDARLNLTGVKPELFITAGVRLELVQCGYTACFHPANQAPFKREIPGLLLLVDGKAWMVAGIN